MAQKSSKSFWQRSAAFYDAFKRSDGLQSRELEALVRPYLHDTDNVLELACGTGSLAGQFSGLVRFWEATDYSDKMISRALRKHTHPSLHYSVRDAEALPYAQESFDTVIICNALHLFPQPEIVLTEIRRVLKPGGILIAPDYVYDNTAAKALRSVLLSMSGLRICSKWTSREYLDFLMRNGFVITEHRRLAGRYLPVCFATAEKRQKDI